MRAPQWIFVCWSSVAILARFAIVCLAKDPQVAQSEARKLVIVVACCGLEIGLLYWGGFFG